MYSCSCGGKVSGRRRMYVRRRRRRRFYPVRGRGIFSGIKKKAIQAYGTHRLNQLLLPHIKNPTGRKVARALIDGAVTVASRFA